MSKTAVRCGALYSVGSALLTALLPVTVYVLAWATTSQGCFTVVPWAFPGLPPNASVFSWDALAIVYGWFALQLLLHVALPGRRKQGIVEPDGQRWTYKLNAFQNFVLTYGVILILTFFTDLLPLGWAADHYVELLTASIIFSVALSCALHIFSFQPGTVIAHAAMTDSLPFNFWMGRCMNPRIAGVDLKEFCELYPGLSGWMILNLAMAHKEFSTTGQVSSAMALVCAFELVYVCDALWNEPSILTTMDITSEGFGYMLVFGDLTWVPFVYCIQARYLVDHPQVLSWPWIAFLIALNFFGYTVFRGSNGQKDLFRTNPNDPRVVHLKTLPTERGTRLICSGWWGVARHINYSGDWLMSLAWSLACGFDCCVPYFYVAYFAVLLIHRDRRDDHACKLKYGADWAKYCMRVPYRLVPFVY